MKNPPTGGIKMTRELKLITKKSLKEKKIK
jgi:hypothetical protein